MLMRERRGTPKPYANIRTEWCEHPLDREVSPTEIESMMEEIISWDDFISV